MRGNKLRELVWVYRASYQVIATGKEERKFKLRLNFAVLSQLIDSIISA